MQVLLGTVLSFFALLLFSTVNAQGLHFSQFNNAPLLLSPANCGLLPKDNYRAGVQYRNQWSQIPVPFNTFSAFADFQLLYNYDHTSWLGLGGALFTDQAGAGDLSLTKFQADVAYHLQLGYYTMLSVGFGLAYAQRSVNFSKLTFDAQWDGLTFNKDLANQESYTFQKTGYPDVSVGLSYAYFPNDNVYFRVGMGLLHVNQPNESFYHLDNKIGMRPTANADVLFKLNGSWICEISSYYTQQKKALELVYGAKFSYNVTPTENSPNILIFGVYQRLDDAIIPMLGFEWDKIQLLSSVDITTSDLTPASRGNGAMEFSIIFKGLYNNNRGKDVGGYNCPRF